MIRKLWAIMEAIEEMLDENDITIPDKDRDGEDDESRLYGSNYYKLEDKIKEILAEEEE